MFYNKSTLQLTRFPCNTHDKTDRGSFERNSHFVAVLRGTFPGFQQLSSAAESSKDNGGLPEKNQKKKQKTAFDENVGDQIRSIELRKCNAWEKEKEV